MSELTPREAADFIAQYEDRAAEQTDGFGTLSGPWGRGLQVLVNHARATTRTAGPVDPVLKRMTARLLTEENTVDEVAHRLMRECNPMCPSLSDADTELYRSGARQAIVAVLTEETRDV